MNADPEGLTSLPSTAVMSIPAYWRQRVQQVMIDEGYKKGAWMYKDSRLSLTWPLWNISFPDAKWIIVRRRTGDIIQSCMKTGYMRAFTKPEEWLKMIHEYEKRFIEIVNEKIDHRIIWPERMVDGDYNQLYELCEWLELKWDEKALEHINKLLWGNKKGENNGSKINS